MESEKLAATWRPHDLEVWVGVKPSDEWGVRKHKMRFNFGMADLDDSRTAKAAAHGFSSVSGASLALSQIGPFSSSSLFTWGLKHGSFVCMWYIASQIRGPCQGPWILETEAWWKTAFQYTEHSRDGRKFPLGGLQAFLGASSMKVPPKTVTICIHHTQAFV